MAWKRNRSLAQSATKALRELRRGAAIAHDGGARAGWTFLREEVVRNTYLRLGPQAAPGRAGAECNVCGWRGRAFLTHCGAGYVNLDAFCPRCMAYPRHRGFADLLEMRLGREIESLRPKDGLRLLFAPEPGMQMMLGRHVTGLEGVDIRRINELVRYIEDIQGLSFPDGSVDFFSCFHVVEHVPDDKKALRELARVLHPEGLAVFNVPMTFDRRESVCFGRANPLANGHWWDHGEDLVERLVEAGFSGTGFRLRSALAPGRFELLRLQDEMIFLLRKPAAGERAEIQDHAGRTLAVAG
ncbi:MAG: class I SAM-dependent methyltransferase [Planctomycetota bacterium]